jgi:hypothetical protein
MAVQRAIKALQKEELQEEESGTVKERLKTLELYKEIGLKEALKEANVSRARVIKGKRNTKNMA